MIDEVVINRVFFVIIIILIALLYISLDENVRLSDIFSQISGEIRRIVFTLSHCCKEAWLSLPEL